MKHYCRVCNRIDDMVSSVEVESSRCAQCGGKLTPLDPTATLGPKASRPAKISSKRKKAILFGLVGSYLVYAVLTGGLYFRMSSGFGGQRTISLPNGAKVGLWLRPTAHEGLIPFVFGWRVTGEPYTPQVFLHELDLEFHSAEVTGASVNYWDGTGWERQEHQSKTISRRRGRSEATFWSGSLENLVTRSESCTLEVKGRILRADGTGVDFEVREDFSAKPRRMGVTTFWMVMARAG